MPAGYVQISDAQYKKLAQMIYRLCGINLGEGKKELLKARLAKRLRATGCPDVRSYLQLIQKNSSGTELVSFLDCITTNKTDFFREPQHFDFLSGAGMDRLAQMGGEGGPVRLWSAACSSGEEPYTLAIVLKEQEAKWSSRGASILASDISTQMLEHAQRGVYNTERTLGIPRPILKKYFQKGRNRWEGFVRVRPELRAMVTYRRINLMDPFDSRQAFHFIFCRNVMIYFDKSTQERLVSKFYDCLVKGGHLFVGHSESLTGIEHRFKFVQPAVYCKEI